MFFIAQCPHHILFVVLFRLFESGRRNSANNSGIIYILQIIHRYDITLIQEIRDASETAIYKLLWKIQTE